MFLVNGRINVSPMMTSSSFSVAPSLQYEGPMGIKKGDK